MANSYKKFLITGASQGIGKAIALKLLKHNFKVTMIHGNKDNSVPIIYSKKVLKIFRTNKIREKN